jgi:hypothetical protein
METLTFFGLGTLIPVGGISSCLSAPIARNSPGAVTTAAIRDVRGSRTRIRYVVPSSPLTQWPLHVQKTWSGILNAPVSLDNVVVAEMLWAAYKAVFTVTAILIVMVALGISTSPKLAVAWLVLAGAGITFASMALIFNALAKGYDFFNYYFTLFLTPMMFLSGVFFPRDQLPPLLRILSDWLSKLNLEASRPQRVGDLHSHCETERRQVGGQLRVGPAD